VLSGELGVSQVFLARSYISGSYVDASEVVVFYDCGKIYVQNSTSILSLSGGESVSPCEVFLYIHFCDLKMAHSGRNMSSSA